MATRTQLLLLAKARKRRADEAAMTGGGAAPAAAAPFNDPGLFMPGSESPNLYTPPTLVDQIMGGLDYADNTGAIVLDRARQGAGNLVGLPVDLINALPMLANLIPGVSGVGPMSDKPIGGSASINDLTSGFGLKPDAPAPVDAFQTIAGRVGEEIGANAVPMGSILAKAGRMGLKAIRESANPLTRMFLEQAAVDPVKFIQKETLASVAAGGGAGVANTVVDRNTAGGQAADLTGALGGAGMVGVGGVVGGAAKNILSALFQNPNYIDQVVKDAVVARLTKNMGLEGATPDTQPLVDMIEGNLTPEQQLSGVKTGVRPADVIPGFQESLADRTANPGLAALEYSRQSGPNSGMFTKRRSENADAVNTAMSAIEPDATPGAFRQELSDTRDLRLQAAASDTQAAQSEFDRYIQTLVPQMGAEERGAAVRSGVSNAERAARESEAALWQAINGEVDPALLVDMLDTTRGGLTEARRSRISDLNDTVDIPRRLSATEDVPEGAIPEPAAPVDMREITDMRSVLLEEQRNALRGPQPDTNRAEAIGRLIDDINSYLGSDAVPAGTRGQVDVARGVSRQVNEDFNRPNDPLAAVLSTKEGRPDVPDSGVAKKFIQPDSGQASNIDRLLAQTDPSSQAVPVRNALMDEIVASIVAMVGDPARLDQYLNQFGRVFDRFPDLRDEIRSAAAAGRTFDQASTAEAALKTDLGTPDGAVKGKGTVGRYLEYSDANSERAINEVLNAKDPAKAADELLGFIGDKPQAVEGARSAFWQKMKAESQSVDNAQRSMGGGRAWRGDWMKAFLSKPATKAVAERLYRDNPEHLKLIMQYADVLDNVDLRQRGKAVGTSGTAQGVNPVLTPETLQSRFYAYMRGAVGGTYLATSIAAVVARRAVRRAQTEAIERLTDKVLLNPELAAEILKDNNPANRAALARKAKLWLGNEASTLIDLLDGDDAEDKPSSAPQDDLVSSIMGAPPEAGRLKVAMDDSVAKQMEDILYGYATGSTSAREIQRLLEPFGYRANLRKRNDSQFELVPLGEGKTIYLDSSVSAPGATRVG